ncbi:White collar 1 protein like [Verticillium longisporum]|uniref:White collar 1 protein like n=1 Tax=Verticillium longisporum TaxID=100787 RepID=A0A8I2ZR63_VERLO|nr:White collar 1 protein like [Verticillium longisporum]
MESYYQAQLPPQERQHRLSQQSAQHAQLQSQNQPPNPSQGLNQGLNQSQQQHALQRQIPMPMASSQVHGRQHMNAMQDGAMVSGDSLDDIIRNNRSEIQRRLSIPNYSSQMAHQHRQQQQHHQQQLQQQQTDVDRRVSMMEFGSNSGQYRNYPFSGPNMNSAHLNNNYITMSNSMNNMGNMGSMNNVSMSDIPSHIDSFSGQDMMQMSPSGTFPQYSPEVLGSMMPQSFANMNMSNMGGQAGGMNMYGSPVVEPQFSQTGLEPGGADVQMAGSPEDQSLGTSTAPLTNNLDLGMTGVEGMTAIPAQENRPQAQAQVQSQALVQQQAETQSQTQKPAQPKQPPFEQDQSHTVSQSQGQKTSPPSAQSGASVQAPAAPSTLTRDLSTNSSSTPPHASSLSTPQTSQVQAAHSAATTPAAGPQTPRLDTKDKSVYSKSGFDMLKALWYVATRKNPEIHLGAVDMSCAFVVCDMSLNDCPIIYVSDNFQNLTGYSRHEIVGQNCRFLQAPDGAVEAGSKREFVDDAAVYNLKQKIHEGKEVQQSLINYRKGGKPFLNLLTMIPIPWDDPDEIRFFVGFQIDLVECPDAIASSQDAQGVQVNYMHSDIGQYIWTPPNAGQWEPENGQTLGVDDVSTLLQQFNPKGLVSDWHKQSWDKMLLENADDVVHVLSLKGLFLYLSPSCKRVLEYDAAELAGNTLSSICHPSDIVPVTRELKDTTPGSPVNIVFRIRRKHSGYTWFESHGSLFVEQGKGRKSIILVGRKRPVFALSRRNLDANGGIGDSELWTKLSTSGMFLFVSSNVRSLLDLQPNDLIGTSIQELMRKESRAEFGRTIEKARRGKIVTCKHEVQNRRGGIGDSELWTKLSTSGMFLFVSSNVRSLLDLQPNDLIGTSIQELMRKESRAEFGRTIEKARRGKIVTCKHEVQNRRGQVLQAQTVLYPGDACEGQKPTFLLAQTKLIKASSRAIAPAATPPGSVKSTGKKGQLQTSSTGGTEAQAGGIVSAPAGGALALGTQDVALAADDNIFDELRTTKCSSWQFELRQMEKVNRILAEELGGLLSNKKKRKRRKGVGNVVRDCANCHTRNTPEWRRGPSGQRDLCNSCGLRWAKQHLLA